MNRLQPTYRKELLTDFLSAKPSLKINYFARECGIGRDTLYAITYGTFLISDKVAKKMVVAMANYAYQVDLKKYQIHKTYKKELVEDMISKYGIKASDIPVWGESLKRIMKGERVLVEPIVARMKEKFPFIPYERYEE